MSRSVLRQAEAAGARVLAGSRVLLLPRRQGRVEGAVASVTGPDGTDQVVRIEADQVFVCAGPTETPALLQRSGIRYHVGNTLRIHPYLKVAARFREVIDAEASVLPLLQVKEFGPDLSLGGAYFTRGHLAMTLSENWPVARGEMAHHRHFAQYYGRVYGYRNLRINDASMLPDSPGVNPQATVMAMARRNALQYAREARGRT